jgi:hypothetical protein
MREIRTIIFVLAGMVTALLTGAVGAAMMMTTQTAQAERNCKVINERGDTTCSGGEGSAGGGFGQHEECSVTGNCFISGGEGGRAQLVGDEHLVGGGGGNIFCTDNPPPCPGSGGSGEHIQGAGGNSGR